MSNMNDQPMVPDSASEVRDIDPSAASPKSTKKSDPKKILIIGAAIFIGLIALVALAFMASTMMGKKGKGNMVAPPRPIDVPATSSSPELPRRTGEPAVVAPRINLPPAEKSEGISQAADPNGSATQLSASQAPSANSSQSASVQTATPAQDIGPAIVKIQTQIDDLTTSVNGLRSVVEQSLESNKVTQSIAAARSAVRNRRPAREDTLRPVNEGAVTQLRPAKNIRLNTMIGNRAWITIGANEYAVTVGEALPDGRTITDINTQDRIVSLSDGSYVSGD